MKLDSLDIVLFDLDGTVYYGSEIIDGANDTINFFRKNGKKIFFTTNNSTKTRKQIYERLIGMGVDCNLEEVLTSGYLAALTAKKRFMEDIYIFGSKNLIEEFENLGVKVNQDETAKNLLIGYDPDMTYDGLSKAVRVALQARCIMACNKERVYPGKDAQLMPGCGAMTAPIEWCANRQCDFVIGKPNILMVEHLSAEYNVPTNRFLVIGDTYESDIAMANVAGCQSILIDKNKDCNINVVDTIKFVPDCFE